MKILVANLGSTSYKYRLYAVEGLSISLLKKGGYERVEDYGEVIRDGLNGLVSEGHLEAWEELDAVGFKTVMGWDLTGCLEADDAVLADLEKGAALAPAHNPAYAAGIRQFREIVPGAKRVALFETAFYQWVAPSAKRYAVPRSWFEAGVRRNGFHGASHKYIAERSAELMDRGDVAEVVRKLYHVDDPTKALEGTKPLRVLSLHLGGSSSITGIRDGIAVGTSMGMTPQSGLPQNNRVGDLDAMTVLFAQRNLGLGLDEIDRVLTKESGLLGLSGVSNDMRDIREAAAKGNEDAVIALEAFEHAIRHWMGALVFAMGGLDAIAFTGGIGENDKELRERVCGGLEAFGVVLDASANAGVRGIEACISSAASKVGVFVIPANEELVIARETAGFLTR